MTTGAASAAAACTALALAIVLSWWCIHDNGLDIAANTKMAILRISTVYRVRTCSWSLLMLIYMNIIVLFQIIKRDAASRLMKTSGKEESRSELGKTWKVTF